MKLPNGDRAVVENEKLMGYVLNSDHPVGKNHAYLFERLLGITQSNAMILKAALTGAAHNAEVDRETKTVFGTKYRLRSEVSGPTGTRNVISVWIIEHEADTPRLITCFVE